MPTWYRRGATTTDSLGQHGVRVREGGGGTDGAFVSCRPCELFFFLKLGQGSHGRRRRAFRYRPYVHCLPRGRREIFHKQDDDDLGLSDANNSDHLPTPRPSIARLSIRPYVNIRGLSGSWVDGGLHGHILHGGRPLLGGPRRLRAHAGVTVWE